MSWNMVADASRESTVLLPLGHFAAPHLLLWVYFGCTLMLLCFRLSGAGGSAWDTARATPRLLPMLKNGLPMVGAGPNRLAKSEVTYPAPIFFFYRR